MFPGLKTAKLELQRRTQYHLNFQSSYEQSWGDYPLLEGRGLFVGLATQVVVAGLLAWCAVDNCQFSDKSASMQPSIAPKIWPSCSANTNAGYEERLL